MTAAEARDEIRERIVAIVKDYPIDTALKAAAVLQVAAMYALAAEVPEGAFVEVCRSTFRVVRAKVGN